MRSCKRRLRGVPTELHLWRCKFTRAGRIVFDIAQDFSATRGEYTDLIRIWCVTLDHKRYMLETDKVVKSFEKSHSVTTALRLVPVGNNDDANSRDTLQERLPRVYRKEGSNTTNTTTAIVPPRSIDAGVVVEQYPPATVGQGSYTLLKFYDLTDELARAILSGLADMVDSPFRVSPDETRIISTNHGRTIILAGRSGTGKTTCACFKLFARWLAAWRLGETHNQIFITASGTLRREVARSFAKMRRAVVPPEVADELDALSEQSWAVLTLKDIPSEAFPLFLSQKNYLEALDGSLSEPFFPRREDGTILWERGHGYDDPDGMSQEIDLSPESDDDEDDDDDDDGAGSDDEAFFDEDGRDGATADDGGTITTATRKWQRQEMGYIEFAAKWMKIMPVELRELLQPALVWCDIVSYIKGSAEAVRTEAGHLSLQQYLQLGKKRAPNFDVELRKSVYSAFLAYEQYKKAHMRYDIADVVAHLSRRLMIEGGYHGTRLTSIYRDEVQDFMQAELLLDLRVAEDPNSMFYCGDTAQTVRFGVSFRFAEIQTLFYEEGRAVLALQEEQRARRLAKALPAAAVNEGGGPVPDVPAVVPGRAPLEMPIIEHLAVNYRTHSGILDAAASTIEVLKRYFPQHIDNLERESAFFSGPVALLVCGGGTEDIARLLSWSDKSDSQVEFGAHQVVLVRSEQCIFKEYT